MDEAISSRLGTKEMTWIRVSDLGGSGKKAKRMANMVIEKVAKKIIDGNLTYLRFADWKGSASEIKQETLSLIADKTSALTSFTCNRMGSDGNGAMASFVADTLQKSPPLTFLELYYTRFENSHWQAICDAFVSSNIKSLTTIDM